MDPTVPEDDRPTTAIGHRRRLLEASVIVSGRNVETLIGGCLDAIAPQVVAGRHELIVVDDASTDGTSRVVTAWAAEHPMTPLCLLVARRRGGPTASRNAGARLAAGELLVFTDGDDRVTPGWLDAFTQASAHAEFLAGSAPTTASAPPDAPLPHFHSIAYAPGNAMAVSRRLMIGLEGFDERIERGGTEVEFAIRAAGVGVTPVLVPEAVTLYNLPMSTREVLRRTFRRQRGHALIATLHPDLVPPHAPSRSVSVAVRGLLDECLLVVARRHTSWKGSLGSMSRFAGCAIWVLRFRIVPPCARPPLRRMSGSHRVAVDTR